MELLFFIVAVLSLAAVIFLQTSPSTAAKNLRNWFRSTLPFIGRRRNKDLGDPSSAKKIVSTDTQHRQCGAESSVGASTHSPKQSPPSQVRGLRQGDKCPRCSDGVVFFDQWSPGPSGPFTAYYRCSKCHTVLASEQEFDGGLI